MHSSCRAKQSEQLRNNKSVTQFFQTKSIPPPFWNACEHVLQLNFKISHIAVSLNTAADLFSRLELKLEEKSRLEIRKKIQTTAMEDTTSLSSTAALKQFLFTQTDDKKDSQERNVQRKEQCRQAGEDWATNEEPTFLKTRIKKTS